ncbi:hypothetical protein [Ulvibacter litoralis]|uniref:Uncharacterized protein n=1 Tax=Ulvibacter litoralis TaxID=227084 RepID=A0A1G7CE74_9FLAO|nr:hypothetical protein [Ulvibacter litoralis]GHC47687.1 hypothetical protein GCM10008083_08650 [Ulvibacter litoralis]SDE37684.1 hypothetical protein SAMN05421855_101328 [Ulvibacter litoralis]
MNKTIAKELFIGLLIGIVSNLAGSYLYLFFLSNVKELSIESTFDVALEQGLLGTVIALGALLNFVAFFVFLKKKQYYRGRGVIFATLIAAIIILISKFY